MPGLPILWFAALAVIISMAYSKQVATQRSDAGPVRRGGRAIDAAGDGLCRLRARARRLDAAADAEIVYLLYQGARCPQPCKPCPVSCRRGRAAGCVGYENGSLGPAIAQAIAARNLYEPVWQSIVAKIGYICMLPPAALAIVAFLVLKIIPQFEKIFKDFGLRLPNTTLALIRVSRWEFLGLLLALPGC